MRVEHDDDSLAARRSTLAFNAFDPATGFDIWLLPWKGELKPRLFLGTRF